MDDENDQAVSESAGSALDLLIRRIESAQSWTALTYAVALCLPITIPWVVLVIALVEWAALTVLRKMAGRVLFYRPPLLLPMLAFVLAVTLSGLLNNGLQEGWASFLTARSFIVYLWGYQIFCRDQILKSKAVQCLLSVGAVSGIWAAIQQRFNFHPFGYPWLQGTGFLSAPMAFAGIMQMLSLLALSLLLTGQYRSLKSGLSNRFLFSAIAAGNVMGVVFALERSAWLGVLCGFLALTLMISGKMFGQGLLGLSMLGGFAFAFVPAVKTRLEPLLDWQQDASASARLRIWQESWHLFTSHPLFGVGVRKFPHFDIPEAIVPGKPYLDHAHSNYLHVLATTGGVGLISFMWLSLATILLALRSSVGKHFQEPITAFSDLEGVGRAISLGVFASMVSLMVSGLFEYNFGTGQVRLLEWFLVAMLPSWPIAAAASQPTARDANLKSVS